MASRCRRPATRPFDRDSAPFVADERGSVAILIGFLAVILILISGLAVDVGRIMLARTALVAATDATGLAVGRALMDGKSAATARQLGEAYFDANAKSIWSAIGPLAKPEIVADTNAQVVTVDATIDVAMTLMRVGGFDQVTIPVRAEVRYAARDLEVGVAIDVTGSMNTAIGGERKIDSLKKAFRNFVETVIPEESTPGRKVRIGVAPYSAAVNLGAYAKSVSDGKSKDDCVTERLTKLYTDAAPGPASGFFATKADGVKDVDPTEGLGHTYTCPGARLLPLTAARSTLIDHVNAFTATGTTGGHFGTQWGWNVVAEDYATVWGSGSAPDGYDRTLGDNPKLVKAVILMTDGVFNVAFRHGKARDQSIQLCNAMKAKGVKVFAVGFGLTNDATGKVAKDTLRQCATAGPEYFADASDAAQLDAAFRQFAAVLGKLRVNQ